MIVSNKIRNFLAANRAEVALFIVLMLTTSLLRFPQLGYSHFYGDETKVIYWNKTIPAAQFLLNQRKGPLQFVVVWVIEKMSRAFGEGLVRLPFAVAGLLSVFVLYLLVRKLFNWKAALITSILFSFNGFFVAFSRTAQYHIFLILFALFAIYLYFLSVDRKSNLLCLLSALSWIVAFSFHYDAVFYLIPIFFYFIYFWKSGKAVLKDFLIYFVAPIFVALCLYFSFYIFGGSFVDNTIDYLTRRITGKNYSLNSSLYTFFVYNPLAVFALPLLTPLIAFFIKASFKRDLLIFWFLATFFVFQLLIANPGTHIITYILPVLILTGYLTSAFIDAIKGKTPRALAITFCGLFAAIMFVFSMFIYIPVFNTGYPWKDTYIGPLKLNKLNKSYNIFLYGFPYNRGWNEISQYMLSLKGVRGIYTNDNDEIARYYLKEIPYTIPGLHFLPQYYIKVSNNQEFLEDIPQMQVALTKNYFEIKRVYFDGQLSAIIYKNSNYVPVVIQ